MVENIVLSCLLKVKSYCLGPPLAQNLETEECPRYPACNLYIYIYYIYIYLYIYIYPYICIYIYIYIYQKDCSTPLLLIFPKKVQCLQINKPWESFVVL